MCKNRNGIRAIIPVTEEGHRISLKKAITPSIRPEKVNSKATHNQIENEAPKQYSCPPRPRLSPLNNPSNSSISRSQSWKTRLPTSTNEASKGRKTNRHEESAEKAKSKTCYNSRLVMVNQQPSAISKRINSSIKKKNYKIAS